jgi:hypothetical protein
MLESRMSKFTIYLENATSPITIGMMDKAGFTHMGILVKALAVPDKYTNELPQGAKLYTVETNELTDDYVLTHSYKTAQGSQILHTTWGRVLETVVQNGLDPRVTEYYKALFLFADHMQVWKRALDAGWNMPIPEGIFNIVDGLDTRGGVRLAYLHVDLFQPPVLQSMFKEDQLRLLAGRGEMTLSSPIPEVIGFRQGNKLRELLKQEFENEEGLPPVK